MAIARPNPAPRVTCCCFLCWLAAPGLRQPYTDDFTGATYTLNTQKLAFEDAEDICNDIGGHVVSYGSVSEQVAVELFYGNKASGAGSRAAARLQSQVCAGARSIAAHLDVA